MTKTTFELVPQVGRVPSMRIALTQAQETHFDALMEKAILIDLHQHFQVLPADNRKISDYFRSYDYVWGYEAARQGGFSSICTANVFMAMRTTAEPSMISFEDLVDEIGIMLADAQQHGANVVRAARTQDIVRAKERGQLALLPSVEHLAIGYDLHRVDVLYGIGVRLAGLTYSRQNYIGAGQYEHSDGGLSDLGIEVVRRMNDLGMAIDLSHSSHKTAMDAIRESRAPTVFSHNAAHTLRPSRRTRHDDELVACAAKGGIVGITAVPNMVSDDPRQDINVVLDHYDYLVKLLGIDHVAIGTDSVVGDGVGVQRHMYALGGVRDYPPASGAAPYLDGLESPADGSNIVRGLLTRGYSAGDILKIAGGNALRVFAEVIG
jgi:membrane dipeptidase